MEVVSCVDTAEAALQACAMHKPQLAFVALKALPTSAKELLLQMQAEYPAMQMVVSSFWGSWEEIQEAKLWGAKAGFSRPPNPQELQRALLACEVGLEAGEGAGAP